MSPAAIQWLREQIMARLGTARALAASGRGEWTVCHNGDFDYTVYAASDVTAHDPVADTSRSGFANYIAASDPQDTTARCEAELAILDDHYILTSDDQNEDYGEFSVYRFPSHDCDLGCVRCHYYTQGAVRNYGYCRTVRAVASGYRHWPGYAEHWGEVA